MRQGPPESATQFPVGTRKRGNDGNRWIIAANYLGVHRWQKQPPPPPSSSSSALRTTRKIQPPPPPPPSASTISIATLDRLRKKYNVGVGGSGSKQDRALSLWRVRGRGMRNEDLGLLLPLLPRSERQQATKLLEKRMTKPVPVPNLRGLWRPLQKPLRTMSREELVRDLRKFRDVWEKLVGRNTDLSDERLAAESTSSLRSLLEFYYGDTAKMYAEDWVRQNGEKGV